MVDTLIHVALAPLTLLGTVVVATGVHYTAMQCLVRLLDHISHGFLRMCAVTVGCVLAHGVEIGCFALSYLLPGLAPWAGTVGAGSRPEPLDCLYFSAQTFSAAGYGDIIASGPERVIAAGESLCGLLLLGWSVTFSMRVRQRVELMRS